MMQPIKFCFSSSVITIGLLHKTNCENFFEKKISKKKEIKMKKENEKIMLHKIYCQLQTRRMKNL